MLDAWQGRYNADWNDTLTPADWHSWDVHECVKAECGVKIYDYLRDPALYDVAPPIPGAIDGIHQLRAMGHRVVFVTATNRFMAGRKLQWLSDYGVLALEYGTFSRDYVEAQDKSLIHAHLMIDDAPHNLKAFRGEYGILFAAPHNLTNPVPGALPCANWRTVIAHFKMWQAGEFDFPRLPQRR